jgi:precorrin-2 dehydrogenase / sirohydrochlorin ferrochelatase
MPNKAINLDYPILLRLQNRLCVVVGGGEVAARKVTGLLECGALVKVIAPEVTKAIAALAKCNKLQHIARSYRRGDLKGAFLVIGATDDKAVNQRLCREAEARAILVNIVDQPDLCNCTMPARVRRGPLTIAISSAGGSPALSKHIREIIETTVGPEYGELAELMAGLRGEVKSRFNTETARRRAWEALMSPEILALLRARKKKEARQKAKACLSLLSD